MNAPTTISTLTATALPAHPMPRAIPLLREIPHGCFTFTVISDDTDPHIRIGDAAVIDPADRTPREGELFLIEWECSKLPWEAEPRRKREIVEAYKSSFIKSDPPEKFRWFVRACNSPRSWAEAEEWLKQVRKVSAADGPYTDDQLEKKLVGRVIGIIGLDPASEVRPAKASRWNGFCDVADDHALPYIQAGQSATVDTHRREPVDGQLYIVTTRPGKAVVMKARSAADGWFLGLPNRDLQNVPDAGPFTPEIFSSSVAGIVVGVMTSYYP